MKTLELREYYEATRDDNELSFEKWCVDHEWQELIDDVWVCIPEFIDALDVENSVWAQEWIESNGDITKYNLVDFIYDTYEDPENFIISTAINL